jgi:purine-binding chemotaxis protein CheW
MQSPRDRREKGHPMEAIGLRDEPADEVGAPARNALQLIAFSIGAETYGVEITTVREIRAWNGATPLPNTRDYVRGVINLRGTIVPIFDLRARFGDGRTAATKTHVVVVMSVGEKWVGILVDAVSDILTVSKDDIHPVPEGNALDSELLTGIVTHESRMVGLIDLQAVVWGARAEG